MLQDGKTLRIPERFIIELAGNFRPETCKVI